MNKRLREAAFVAKELAELAAEGEAEAGVGILAKCLVEVIDELSELRVRVDELEEER